MFRSPAELSFNTILHILLLHFSTHRSIVFIFYFIAVVVCSLSSFILSHYYRLSLFHSFSSVVVAIAIFISIHSMKPKTCDKRKEKRRKESSITYSTRPLEHQLRFWHATLINLRIIETQRHLLMYFRCAMLGACLCLLWVRALFVAKRLLMKVNVHLYCWFMWACVCVCMRMRTRARFSFGTFGLFIYVF